MPSDLHDSQLYTPTDIDIISWVGSTSFSRSLDYTGEMLSHLKQNGNLLKCQSFGSEGSRYKVEVTLNQTKINEGHCSCFVGDNGRCKHVAALLIAWRNERDRFEKPVESETSHISMSLNTLSKQALIDLIDKMVDRFPELINTIDLQLMKNNLFVTSDMTKFKARVKDIFKQPTFYDHGTVLEMVNELEELMEIGETYFTNKDWHNALKVYTEISLGTINKYDENFYDETGDLSDIIDECVSSLGKILVEIKAIDQREIIFHTLFEIYYKDIKMGGIGLGGDVDKLIIEQSTLNEREKIAKLTKTKLLAADDWSQTELTKFLFKLEAHQMNDETFINICKQRTDVTYELVDWLLKLNKIDDVIETVKKTNVNEFLEMSKIFDFYKQDELYERLMTEKDHNDIRVLTWLKSAASKRGELERVRQLTETIFWKSPTITVFIELKQLTHNWPETYKLIVEKLKGGFDTPLLNNYALLIKIYLHENDTDNALNMVKRSKTISITEIELEVARAVENTKPQESIDIYFKYAEQYIENRGRSNYITSVRYLSQVQKLYQSMKREDEWLSTIKRIRKKNQRLGALMDELNKANL